jgi:hypothetical protein
MHFETLKEVTMGIGKSYDISRRAFLRVSGALGLGLVGGAIPATSVQSESAVPDRRPAPDVAFDRSDTAIVFIDPQNDVLSEKGAAWGAVGDSVKENKTIENMERIFKAAKSNGYEVFISPTISTPRIRDGNSTDPSTLMSLRRTCSLAAEH